MNLKFLMFFGIILLAYGLANVYVIVRALQALNGYPAFRVIIATLIAVAAASFFVSMAFDSKLPHAVTGVLYPFSTVWMAALLYFLMILIAIDLVRIANYFLHFLPDVLYANYAKTKLIVFFVVTGVVFIICSVGYYRFSHPVTTNLSLTVPKQAGEMKHLRIAMISDLHLGHFIKNERVAKYVEQINSLNPDIVLIAGDIIDRDLNVVKSLKIAEEFKQLKAPLGVYSSLGNHEYISQHVDEACDYLASAGITVLRDGVVKVNDAFYVIGRDDRTNHDRKPLSALIDPLDTSLPIIVLDHQPAHLEEAEKAGIDLQLSGHTHHGQLFPLNYITRRVYELDYGYLKKGNTNIYVSSGLGLWGPPFRIGTVSEVVCIDIDFEE